jgi:hypothetical protein
MQLKKKEKIEIISVVVKLALEILTKILLATIKRKKRAICQFKTKSVDKIVTNLIKMQRKQQESEENPIIDVVDIRKII